MRHLLRSLLVPLAYFSNNLISRIGIFLVTAATVLWIFAIPTFLLGSTSNPYAGILLLLILPGFFFIGLALIPLGIVRRRRAENAVGSVLPEKIDFGSSRVRNVLGFVAAATVVNLAIGSQLTYSAVNYMDGISFCGTSCHVMAPEFNTFSQSAHRNVECVGCHAGPGAAGFAASKMAGVHQLVDTLLNRYERPVHPPTPPLPSKDTCERCHNRTTPDGDKLLTFSTFAADEKNTRADTVMLMHVGGGVQRKGIHGAHLGAGVQIEYAADSKDPRMIRWVRYRAGQGAVTTYAPAGAGPAPADAASYRTMECVDCHNRVAHPALSPDAAMDKALAQGEISTTIPFIRRQGALALKEAKSEGAVEVALRGFYSQQTPAVAEPELKAAIVRLRQIWRERVFPELNVSWGTHDDQKGHTSSPGCFRCHDGDHKAADGKAITQDCEACHHISALEETKPKILDELGAMVGQ